MICTKRRLNEEIEQIKKILLDNGYPKNIINTQITKKIAQFSTGTWVVRLKGYNRGLSSTC